MVSSVVIPATGTVRSISATAVRSGAANSAGSPAALRMDEGTQEQGVHDREDGRIGSEAEGERQDRDCREQWSPAEHPGRVTNVLKHLIQHGFPAPVMRS